MKCNIIHNESVEELIFGFDVIGLYRLEKKSWKGVLFSQMIKKTEEVTINNENYDRDECYIYLFLVKLMIYVSVNNVWVIFWRFSG